MDPGEPLSFPQPLSTHRPSHNPLSLPSQRESDRTPPAGTTRQPASAFRLPQSGTTRQPASASFRLPQSGTTRQPASASFRLPQSGTTRQPASASFRLPQSGTTRQPASAFRLPQSGTIRQPASASFRLPQSGTTRQPASASFRLPQSGTTRQPASASFRLPQSGTTRSQHQPRSDYPSLVQHVSQHQPRSDYLPQSLCVLCNSQHTQSENVCVQVYCLYKHVVAHVYTESFVFDSFSSESPFISSPSTHSLPFPLPTPPSLPPSFPSPHPSLPPCRPLLPPIAPTFCTEHNRLLDFFCEQCDQLMCASCAVKQRCGHDVCVYMLMRDEKEGRKKQAMSNKQQGKATQHTQGSHFSQDN